MCLIALEAPGNTYGGAQIPVAPLPVLEGPPIAIGCTHLSCEDTSEELRYRDVFFGGFLPGPVGCR